MFLLVSWVDWAVVFVPRGVGGHSCASIQPVAGLATPCCQQGPLSSSLCTTVSPPEPLRVFSVPSRSTWASVQQGDWAPSKQEESSRPPKGQAWDWQCHCWPPRFGWSLVQAWLEGGVAGCCLWRLRPLCLCPCCPFGTTLHGFPRSLVFSFPDEFLVRPARARVQPGCASSGEHPSSDNAVCPNSQGH